MVQKRTTNEEVEKMLAYYAWQYRGMDCEQWKQIPERVPTPTRRKTELRAAKAKLARLKRMSQAEVSKHCVAHNKNSGMETLVEFNSAIRDRIKAWQADGYEDFKEFMLKRSDWSSCYVLPKPKPLTPKQWLRAQTKVIESDITHHEKAWEHTKTEYKELNAWLRGLRKSLGLKG